MPRSIYLVLFSLFSLVFTTQSLANESYQIALGAYYSKIDREDGLEGGDTQAIDLIAYAESFETDGSLAITSDAFYQRISGFQLANSKTEFSDLGASLGGRIAKSYESDVTMMSLFLAREDLDVWANLSYTRFGDTDVSFNSGDDVSVDLDPEIRLVVGWFLVTKTSVSALVGQGDEYDVYGIGGRHVLPLGEYGSLEGALSWERIKEDDNDPEVVNNTIRNLDVDSERIDEYAVSLRYMPFAYFSVGGLYSWTEYDATDAKAKWLGLDMEYCVSGRLCLGFQYMTLDWNVTRDTAQEVFRVDNLSSASVRYWF